MRNLARLGTNREIGAWSSQAAQALGGMEVAGRLAGSSQPRVTRSWARLFGGSPVLGLGAGFLAGFKWKAEGKPAFGGGPKN